MSGPPPVVDRRAASRAGGLTSAARLTPDQRRARASKAGAASVEARRRRLREQLADPEVRAWLDACPPVGPEQRAALSILIRQPSRVDGAA